MMEIYLPIFKGSLHKKKFDLINGQNPGIGGTQHVTLLLADKLAKIIPDWTIFIAHSCEIKLSNNKTNFKQKKFSNFKEFSKFLASRDVASTRAIINSKLLEILNEEELNLISKKSYCWLHHPFAFNKKLKKARFLEYVCVGEYQYLSNRDFYPNCTFIQNIFPNYGMNSNNVNFIIKEKKSPLKLVFLGALVPSKGFHLIAEQWNNIKESFSDVKLDVIGSINTYFDNDDDSLHKLIPTSKDYGELIMQYIDKKDIEEKRIIFHGNIGKEKEEIIKNADLALQNPTGKTEAFPASPIECMSFGTPVIASDDYGMYDSMKYFPELSINNPNQISQKISLALSSQSFFNELKLRSISISVMFSLRSEAHIWRWVDLIKTNSVNKKINNLNVEKLKPKKLINLKLRQIKRNYPLTKSSIFKFLKRNLKKSLNFK